MGKGAETRQEILRHGVTSAYHVGLAGLTIGKLALHTGMSKSGLFAHFQSKEGLQLEVLAQARADFIDTVIRPALAVPRGERRVRELFERWINCGLLRRPGGCLFVKAATELDEQEGPVRERLSQDHRDLLDTIAQVFRTGIAEGEFRDDADPHQFAYELNSIMLGFYHAHRLLRDDAAERRARRAFDALLDAARAQPTKPVSTEPVSTPDPVATQPSSSSGGDDAPPS
ncbi:TetR/AcrR family transcriptional regulator [Actinobacteria bacterium YIM 96077]|uniref:TetR/AcrR family transcriptional regulator n=1 Tax=Phytoactinopolyspora halophila TaxID=1981511 RepID=A0A329QKU6_9ACTN|nr:TetR/AcrR family transcriptional regulator [Phytoactinopolyspora halophila]AYY12391.1 TetR/AcrR family transcriptional regulator [Actinobacteria bacterium YIM 96077]RAW12032.1 TetR/AcrR family transcriptional regulator [Phytoactinopolyspora halophila]